MGWFVHVLVDADVVFTSASMLGASGSFIYSPSGEHSLMSIKILEEYQSWPNLDGEQVAGSQAINLARWLVNWKSKHWGEAVAVPSACGKVLQIQSVVVVIIVAVEAVVACEAVEAVVGGISVVAAIVVIASFAVLARFTAVCVIQVHGSVVAVIVLNISAAVASVVVFSTA